MLGTRAHEVNLPGMNLTSARPRTRSKCKQMQKLGNVTDDVLLRLVFKASHIQPPLGLPRWLWDAKGAPAFVFHQVKAGDGAGPIDMVS